VGEYLFKFHAISYLYILKNIDIHHWYIFTLTLISGLLFLNLYNTKLMALSQAEVAAKLDVFGLQLGKIAVEVQAVKDALAAALAAGTEVSPELQAAVDNLGSALQVVDDLNPDA
jgi:hypothetical protein